MIVILRTPLMNSSLSPNPALWGFDDEGVSIHRDGRANDAVNVAIRVLTFTFSARLFLVYLQGFTS